MSLVICLTSKHGVGNRKKSRKRKSRKLAAVMGQNPAHCFYLERPRQNVKRGSVKRRSRIQTPQFRSKDSTMESLLYFATITTRFNETGLSFLISSVSICRAHYLRLKISLNIIGRIIFFPLSILTINQRFNLVEYDVSLISKNLQRNL